MKRESKNLNYILIVAGAILVIVGNSLLIKSSARLGLLQTKTDLFLFFSSIFFIIMGLTLVLIAKSFKWRFILEACLGLLSAFISYNIGFNYFKQIISLDKSMQEGSIGFGSVSNRIIDPVVLGNLLKVLTIIFLFIGFASIIYLFLSLLRSRKQEVLTNPKNENQIRRETRSKKNRRR